MESLYWTPPLLRCSAMHSTPSSSVLQWMININGDRLTVRQRRGPWPLHAQFCLFSYILLARGGDLSEAACSQGATSEGDGGAELPGSGSSSPIRQRILMQVSLLSACPCFTYACSLLFEVQVQVICPILLGLDGKRGRVSE